MKKALTQKATMMLIVGLLPFGFVGCTDSQKLSRDRAKDLIQRNEDFAVWVAPQFEPQTRDISDIHKRLQTAGMITVSLAERGVLSNLYNVTLTDSGKKYLIGVNLKTGKVDPTSSTLKLKICNYEVQEVTGIEQSDGNATVHITYKPVDVTPFGAVAPDCSPAGTREGRALLVRFDDGWRIQKFGR